MTSAAASPLGNLRAALAYHAIGYCPVLLHERIPQEDGTAACSCGDVACTHQGKHPRLPNWTVCAAKATESDIRRLWSKHPNANVGLLCGDWSNIPAQRVRRWIVVLDVDARFDPATGKTGIEVLDDWENAHGKLPDTAVQKTPSGGYHYVFQHPGVPITTRSNVLPKVDVRGDRNGQIVVSPSPGYGWDARLDDTPIARIPDALLDLIAPARVPSSSASGTVTSLDPPDVAGWPPIEVRAERAKRYLAKLPVAVSGQGGHDKTWQASIHVVRGFALPQGVALELLREYNARCVPPWSERAIAHKIQDAALNAKMLWGAKLASNARPARPIEPPIPDPPDHGPGSQDPASDLSNGSGPDTSDGSDNYPDAYADAHHSGGPADPPAPPGGPQDPPAASWQALLIRDQYKRVRKILANVVTILANADGWADAVMLDDFAQRVMLQHPTPAHAGHPAEVYPRQWRDADDVLTAEWMQRDWRLDVSSRLACEAIVAVAQRKRVHPVREYLSQLRWDGHVRLNTWLSQYLGAQQDDYTAAIGAKWMISAVARVMRPGCQADAMLILEGPQGIRKSTGLETLAGREWFTDQLADIGQGKEPSQDLAGKWIVEIAELDAMRRAETSRVKAFLTRRTDHFRASYGRHSEDRPRQCVFAGSVNLDTYLTDETGNRRFWPVRVTSVDIEALRRDRDILWAEAVARFESNEPWYLDDPKVIAMAAEEQADRFQSDAWEEAIIKWLEGDRAETLLVTRKGITTGDILQGALNIDKDGWDKPLQTRVGAIMTKLRWRKRRIREQGDPTSRVHIYEPPLVDGVEAGVDSEAGSEAGSEGGV
jgi:predicted P-loop ATPase